MDVRYCSKKPYIKQIHREEGVALFMTMMLTVLLLGFLLIMFQNASLEGMIAGYAKREVTTRALAESGLERTLAWFAEPNNSPDSDFFKQASCPDGTNRSYVNQTLGAIKGTVNLDISRSLRKDGSCTVKARTAIVKWVQVDIGRNPMPKITTAVQGGDIALDQKNIYVSPDVPGGIRWKSEPLDPVEMIKIRSFIRRFGRSFHLSEQGCLREDGKNRSECLSFDQHFSVKSNPDKAYDLAYVEAPDEGKPVVIGMGLGTFYKGYFYFAGDVTVEGSVAPGQSIAVESHSTLSGMTFSKSISNIHLDGFIYTPKKVIFHNPLNVYGAVYAGSGFVWKDDCTGRTPCLSVWYNSRFSDASYDGVVPMIRIPGTWRTM